MELSKRLQAVSDLVSQGRCVADIGCDHGYVSIYLAKNRKCPKIIAMDIREGPLSHAKTNILKYGMQDKIEVRISDGTKALRKGEVDTLLISGMGGRLIRRILGDGFHQLGFFQELVLQPQSEIEIVRQFLRENEYIIVDEDFVIEDGKYYPMVKALYQKSMDMESIFKQYPYCESAYKSGYTLLQKDLFGPVLLQKRPGDFLMFLADRKAKTVEILKKITQQKKREEMLYYLEQLTFVSENPKG